MDQSVLKIVPVSSGIEFIEMGDQGIGVSRPENQSIHIHGCQADPFDLSWTEGATNEDKTLSNAVEEPFSVKGGDVRPSADTDNHERFDRDQSKW